MTVASLRQNRGFTLIELVITVAIVAILAAIAIPGYQGQRRKTNREVARLVLTELVAKQEAVALKNRGGAATRGYARDFGPLYGRPGATTLYLDAQGKVSAAMESKSLYKLELASPDSDAFTFTATALGPQAKDTDCATMSIAHTGAKQPRNEVCWTA